MKTEISLTKKEILTRLKHSPLEDQKILGATEKKLKLLRGYTFEMPKPGSTVLCMLSGGVDTCTVMGILLEKFKLKIIPVYIIIQRDKVKRTLQAAKEIVNFYKTRYPNKVEDLITITSTFPSPEILKTAIDNCWKITDKKTGKVQGLPFELDTFAGNLIVFLQNNLKYENVKTIFFGIHAGDVKIHQHHTLTAFRTLMLHVCAALGDYNYQITSLPLEKEVGFFYNKVDLIKLSDKFGFPLNLTITCRAANKYHCGTCILCNVRRSEFKLAKIPDPTIYENERQDLVGKLKRKSRILKKIFINL